MSKVIGVITARMGSTRLPGKIMLPLAGKSMFYHVVERLKIVKNIQDIFLATSKDIKNKELIDEAKKLNCGVFIGDEEDVIGRYVNICEQEKADGVVRVSGDCPLFDIDCTNLLVNIFREKYYDYVYVHGIPSSLNTMVELFSAQVLKKIYKNYKKDALAIPIVEHIDEYSVFGVKVSTSFNRPEYRLCVDYLEDYLFMNAIYSCLYKGKPISLLDVYTWLDNTPIVHMNKMCEESEINKYFEKLEKILWEKQNEN